MTEQEFTVLDALYFVTPFGELKEEISYSESDLVNILRALLDKGWIRIYDKLGQDVDSDLADLEGSFAEYLYLASKAGLKAHNQV